MADEPHLPWTTGPTGQGASMCDWCHREIHAPALPCSVEPVAGLMRMETQPGFGARCQYELSTRRPDLVPPIDGSSHERRVNRAPGRSTTVP